VGDVLAWFRAQRKRGKFERTLLSLREELEGGLEGCMHGVRLQASGCFGTVGILRGSNIGLVVRGVVSVANKTQQIQDHMLLQAGSIVQDVSAVLSTLRDHKNKVLESQLVIAALSIGVETLARSFDGGFALPMDVDPGMEWIL
jgi:hypothetical protein